VRRVGGRLDCFGPHISTLFVRLPLPTWIVGPKRQYGDLRQRRKPPRNKYVPRVVPHLGPFKSNAECKQILFKIKRCLNLTRLAFDF
jgi:hypothetical protein